MKFIVYFTHEEYGYKEFEVKDTNELDESIDRFSTYSKFPDGLDHIKDNGWQIGDIEELKERNK